MSVGCWGSPGLSPCASSWGTKHSLHLSWGLQQVRDSSCLCHGLCHRLCHRQSSGNWPQSAPGSLLSARGSAWSTGTEHTRGSSQPAVRRQAGAQLPAQIPANTPVPSVPSHHTEAQSPQVNTEGFVTPKEPLLQSARAQT